MNLVRRNIKDFQRLTDLFKEKEQLSVKGITMIMGKEEEKFFSYWEMYEKSLGILYLLQEKGLKPGEELIFQLADHQDFIHLFWACLLGGIIPVPVTVGRTDEHKLKLLKIWKVLNNPYMITSEDTLERLEEFCLDQESLRLFQDIQGKTLSISDFNEKDYIHSGKIHQSDPDDIAYIQFSSGSTGNPKGVTLTHRNLLANVNAIIQGSAATVEDRYFSWMPLTHDMGIIGWHLTPLFVSCDQYLIPTELFIRNPVLWLDKVSEHQATVLSSPNFGYKHFLKRFKPEKAKDWDLSPVRIVYNGAEPISVDLCEEFLATMAPYGLKYSSMTPCYGMAEACLAVTIPPLAEEYVTLHLDRNHLALGSSIRVVRANDPNSVAFVQVGTAVEDCRIRICDENNDPVPDGQVGYIHIGGTNVTQGYYNNHQATQTVISEDGWLNTEDLGFIHNGELIITGRAKDIIFVNGQNYYPHDLERIAEELEEIELNKIAICGAPDPSGVSEQILCFVIFKKKPKYFIPLLLKIKRLISKKMGLELAQIIPVRTLPKTTSGKLQRYKLSQEFQQGQYAEVVAELDKLLQKETENREVARPVTAVETKLVQICQEILGIKRLGIHEDLREVGFNSLKAAGLTARIQQEFQVTLSIRDLFYTPTVKELAKKVESSEKSQLIPITKLPKKEYYSASSVQKRLFALNQLDVEQTNYNLPHALVIEGDLNQEQLRQAVQQLVQIHESFRTSFVIQDNQLVQRIAEKVKLEVSLLRATVDELADLVKDFIRPFDLSRAPLLRVELISFDDKHLLLIDMHHIISDGTSMGLFLDQLLELYSGNKVEKPEFQYKEFTVWQQEFVQSQLYKEQEAYWLEQFADEIPVLNLPTDHPRPSVMTYTGDLLRFTLDAQGTKGLNKLAQEQDATLFMTLLSVYYLLLSRYTDQQDLIIGTGVSGRSHAAMENVIGMFVNTLALRQHLITDQTFQDFLADVREHSWRAFENQDYQFEDLIDQLGLKRSLSRNVLFDVMFVMQNTNKAKILWDGLTLSAYEFSTPAAKYDLTLHAFEEGDKIVFELEYSTELFTRETVERMAAHYLHLIDEVTTHPEYQLNKYQMILPEEKKEILEQFNDTQVDYPKEKTIQQLFEEQVAKTPEKLALEYNGQQLTYTQLNQRANQLAHLLRKRGIGADEAVGILAERSLEMIIAVLAVIKVGGAYLPIDVDYPEKRMEYMLEDSGVRILLAQDKYVSKLDFTGEILDLDNPKCYQGSTENLEIINQPNDLIYIIYTSGSTGEPKGVMVEHQNVNRLISNSNMLVVQEKDRILQTGSLAFDASTFEIWGSLLNGATLYLVKKDILLSPEKFGQKMHEYQITMIWMTAPLFNQFIEADPDIFATLNLLIIGGDVISPAHVRIAHKYYPTLRIFNGYGPTESTTFTTHFEITGEITQDQMVSIPIGRPITNTQVYILDTDLNLQPVGAVGEIYIGGDGLARGYLKKPALTQEKFISNPYQPGQRLYRTGDLACWLPDGNIDFLGRVDFQVKIRGFRIELDEIQLQLLQNSWIGDVVVIARKEQGGEKYLCAYYTAEKELSPTELRQELSRELPDYMIPSYFIQMDQLPLTDNGKFDRQALPAPEKHHRENGAAQAPRTEGEVRMAQIWKDVLQVDWVGLHDHFFELGGHSLKATFLTSRIYKEFNVEVPLRQLFKTPTLEEIVRYVLDKAESKYAKIEPVPEQEYYPVSSAQKRLFIINRRERANITYNVPFIKIVEGEIDGERLANVFQQLIQRHESLRTSFVYRDQEPMQKIHSQLEVEIQEVRATEDKWPSIVQNFIRPFDLGKPPLFRVGLVRGEERSLLMLDVHHIVADGLSLSILIRELVALYQGEALSDLTVQYKDYAIWQQQLLQSDELQSQENYWLNLYQDEIPVLNMPTDFPRPQVKSYVGDSLLFNVDEELTAQLQHLAVGQGATLYMVLLAAYYVLLHKYSGQEDLVVGSATAGRPHADLEDMVGVFINSLALRNTPRAELRFDDFLAQVKEKTLEAYENQDYQFDRLVEKLDIPLDTSRSPLYDTMFGLQNIDSLDIATQDFSLAPYQFEYKISKFDSILLGEESPDGLRFRLEYSLDLFKPETMERFARHYVNILTEIVRDGRQRIGDIQVLDRKEKELLLDQFNQTTIEYDQAKTVPDLFEIQVAQQPNQPAIVYDDRVLTYVEVNYRANQLARRLRAHGLEPDDIVGIMLERSPEMYIAQLAILKAGGAFLSLDLTYPRSRIEYMLEDSGAKYLIATSNTPQAQLFTGTVFFADEEISSENGTNLERVLTPNNLAYVIYTSGSTGRPKGVLLEHKGLVNLQTFFTQSLEVDSTDRIIQFASASFDASVWETMMALLTGATLYPIPEEMMNSYRAFEEFLIDNEISIMTLPPVFLTNLDATRKYSLRKIITAGSATNGELVKAWQKQGEYINAYGPTETTICTSIWRGDLTQARSVPIGKPIANSKVYILDENRNLQPVGVVGELCVSGISLARGYLNRPQLTADKFVDHPFVPAEKLYRTGDLARWLPDGNIEFRGRIDHQVKIRGFRIELGEIIGVLQEHFGVKDVTVIDREDENGEKYLVAYLIGDDRVERELREYLMERLPDYMVPAYFVFVDQFTLTTSGKIDRKALPDPETMEREVEGDGPTTETEDRLLKIWQQVLNRAEIGIHDNFFELGGHSLKATQLGAVVLKEMNVELSLMEVFERPTIAEMAAYLDGATQGNYTAIEPVDAREYYPVSSAQKRLFALGEMEGKNITYNIPGVWKIVGELDVDRLEKVIQQLIQRHEAFRTYFDLVDGESVQKIVTDVDFRFNRLKSSVANIKEELTKFVQPFDLRIAPLIRGAIVEMERDEYLLMLDMHHIIADGVSLEILFNELAQLYEGEELEPLTIQYKDFAVWQEEFLQSPELMEQERFWLDLFWDEIPILNLPTDEPRPHVRDFAGKRIHGSIPSELVEELKKLAQGSDATLYMVLLAAFNLLLHRYTGQSDIVVGSPIAGRPHGDLDQVIGMFVNTLAMRNYPSSDKLFIDFLDEVRDQTMIAFENQDYQFERLVEQLDLQRDLSRNPLFDVMFALQNANRLDVNMGDLRFIAQDLVFDISKFDLTLNAIERDDEMVFVFEYATSLFKESTIRRMLGHYIQILHRVVERPGTPLGEVDLLTADEKDQILKYWNRAENPFVKREGIQQLIEEQADLRPETIALVAQGKEISYGQLNATANQLARKLRKNGVQAETIVGLFMDRSIELAIGMLAIWKAGGAYLPLDPTYPKDRLAYMIEDSQLEILLSKDEFIDQLDMSEWGVPTIKLLNMEDTDWAEEGMENLTPANTPESLAYVIYTSGSTGKPKGVMVQHQGILNTILWRRGEYHLDHTDRVLQLFSFAFDGFLTSFLTPLAAGSQVILLTNAEARDLTVIGEAIKKYGVTHFISVPSLYRVIVQNLDPTAGASLQIVTLAGEQVPAGLVQESKEKFPTVELVNEYGPTENSVASTIKRDLQPNNPITIGKPVANVQSYILDANLQLLPIGVPGELCLAGVGLAKGYLGQPDLTAEKFVPLELIQGARIYRTGDRARWLENGEIEFLGRIDEQVKIRGYRVEPGEIEKHLIGEKIDLAGLEGQSAEIEDAVVLAKKTETGQRELAVYLVSSAALTGADVRHHLLQRLPEYMIPTRFAFLDELPLLANGKVDRQQLLDMELTTPTKKEHLPPQSDVEVAIATAWAGVLGSEKVGLRDNYFELGGDSIKAIQIVARLKTKGVQITVQDIFQYRTVGELALHARQTQVISAEQGPVTGEVAPTAIIQRFLQEDYANPGYWNQSLLFALASEVDVHLLARAWSKLIQHHDALRFNLQGGVLFHNPDHLEMDFSLESYDLSQRSGQEQDRELERLAVGIKSSLDLASGLLVKGAIFDLGRGERRMLITIHHLAVDGVSWRILIEDLINCYDQLAKEQEICLPLKTSSFKEWANSIHAYSESSALSAEVDYWQETLDQFQLLPTPEPIGNGLMEGASKTLQGQLSEKETEKLLTAANGAYQTETQELLLVGLARAIKNWQKREDLVVHLEGHGRAEVLKDLDVSRTVGWFTSLYPLHLQLQSDDLSQQIKGIKESIRQIPERGFGYGILKYISQKLPQDVDQVQNITFNYLGQFSHLESHLFNLATENTGPDFDPQNHRTALLDITSVVSQGVLQIRFDFLAEVFTMKEMESLLQDYLQELQVVIQHCLGDHVGGLTPSDVALADVDQDFLDELADELL